MIEFAKLLKSSLGQRVRTVLAQVAMFGSEGDDENAEQSENCEALHPIGFVSRPTSGSGSAEAVIVRDGDEVHVLFFLDKTDALHDCEEGEAQVYSPKEPSCRIRFRASGDIEILPKDGQKVYVGAPNGTGGMEPAGLGTSIKNQLNALKSYIDGHTHIAGTLAAPNGTVTGTSGVPSRGSPSVPDVEADNVVVK